MDATHGTIFANLEARLVQTDLKLNEAIRMASMTESQVNHIFQLDDLDDEPFLKSS